MSYSEDQIEVLEEDEEETRISIWFKRQMELMMERYGG